MDGTGPGAREWRLEDIAQPALDGLPFGAIVVDYEGTIVAYNDYEARLSRRDRERVIGRNFFRDVAPCTAVQAFEGRMKSFVKSKDRVSTAFDYFFPFLHGRVEVTITFIKIVERRQVLIAVERVDAEQLDRQGGA
jgi:photoactive yellow protein